MRYPVTLATGLALAAMTFAGCGEQPVDHARPASVSNVSSTVEAACEGYAIKQITSVTKKAGYGSRTAYLLVLCGNNSVARVDLGD